MTPTQATHGWQIFALGSAFFAGLTAVLGKVGVAELNSNFATLFRTMVVFLMLLAIVTLHGDWPRTGATPWRSLVFLVLSAIATGLSWLCYYHALKLGPASKVAPVDKLSVVFAIILALVFLGEKLSWQVAIGGVLVTAGALVLALA